MGAPGPETALKNRRPDIIDRPPGRKIILDLALRYPSRPVSFGFEVAETEHKVCPAREQDRPKVPHEYRPVVVGKGMEKS